MNAAPFDTLRLATDLEKAGFTTEQSRGLSTALAGNIGSELVTKSDLDRGLLATRADLREELTSVRTDLKDEIASVRTELKGEIKDLENRMTLRVGGMIATAVALLVAVDKLI